MKKFAKLALLLSLVLFAAPFTMVSCSELDVTETYSGFQLMVGVSGESDELISSSYGESAELSPNVWLIGAFICLVAALVVLFVKKKTAFTVLAPVGLPVAAILFMLIFKFSFVSYYSLEDMEKYLVIKSQFGFVLSIVFALAGGVCAFLGLSEDSKSPSH